MIEAMTAANSILEICSLKFDNFEGEEKAAEKFKKSLCSFEQDSGDSFYNAILYSLVYKLSNKKLN